MITFLQDNEGWACLAAGREIGRIVETAEGYALRLQEHASERFADLTDAQGRAMDLYDPDWREAENAARSASRRDPVGIAHAPAQVQDARSRRRASWKGGPKRGTHYAKAESIKDSIRKVRLGEVEFDNRDRSAAHAQAYALAAEAASFLGEAQGMSPYPECRRIESSLRAKGARLVSKADALMPEVRRIDREHIEALLARIDSERSESLSPGP